MPFLFNPWSELGESTILFGGGPYEMLFEPFVGAGTGRGSGLERRVLAAKKVSGCPLYLLVVLELAKCVREELFASICSKERRDCGHGRDVL